MKRLDLLLIALLFLTLLAGCWDKKELNDLAIAVGLAIDKSEGGYKLSTQIVNPSEVSPQANSSGITPVTVRSKQGKTMYEAIRRLSLTNSRRIYTSHLRLLVISEEVAKEGITEVLDYLSRDKDFRANDQICKQLRLPIVKDRAFYQKCRFFPSPSIYKNGSAY